jgi:peptide/nickel transport system substrate-binding protein
VRQAVAYALPYRDLLQASVFGHAVPLFGAPSATPKDATFPQPYPYDTDLDKAKKLIAAAGLAGGFETTFSSNVSDATLADPIALLVQESLANIGVKVTIDRVPEAQWGTQLTQRKIPFYTDSSSAWFNDPDYFFRIFFQGDWRWNFGNFDDAELNGLVNAARWEQNPAKYDEAIRQAIAIAFEKLPLLPLWLPSYEAALRPGLTDFTYYIHGQVDFRSLKRS